MACYRDSFTSTFLLPLDGIVGVLTTSRNVIRRVSVIRRLQYIFVYCMTDMSFSQEQRVFIVGHYFASHSYAHVADEFRWEYPDSAVSNNLTITKIINRFWECGSVSDRKRSRRPAILTEAKVVFVRCKVININSKCCISCSLCIKPAK
jgi:hypothetical protein